MRLQLFTIMIWEVFPVRLFGKFVGAFLLMAAAGLLSVTAMAVEVEAETAYTPCTLDHVHCQADCTLDHQHCFYTGCTLDHDHCLENCTLDHQHCVHTGCNLDHSHCLEADCALDHQHCAHTGCNRDHSHCQDVNCTLDHEHCLHSPCNTANQERVSSGCHSSGYQTSHCNRSTVSYGTSSRSSYSWRSGHCSSRHH